ncbi:protein translocase subunit SecF, partial [Candidatus Falkowbacteria bacterium]|nr:protein translocase subunit SecF [Candidatus Falkowbacteria bacterium]
MTHFKIIQKRAIWLWISGILFVVFGVALILWRFKFGIDFTGGSLLEVNFAKERPTVSEVQSALSDKSVGELGSLIVQPVGNQDMILRFQDSTEEKHQAVLSSLDKLAKTKSKDNKVE